MALLIAGRYCSPRRVEAAANEMHLDAQLGQRVVEEIVSAAVERRGGYDLVTGRGEGNRSQGLGRLSGSGGQSGDATLEGRDPFFENIGGRIHDPGINVSKLLKRKQAPGMVGVVKHVRCGLLNRHGAGLRGRVDDLSAMDGQSGKVLLFFSVVFLCHDGSHLSLINDRCFIGFAERNAGDGKPVDAEIRPAGTRRFPEHATPLHQYHNPDSLTID